MIIKFQCGMCQEMCNPGIFPAIGTTWWNDKYKRWWCVGKTVFFNGRTLIHNGKTMFCDGETLIFRDNCAFQLKNLVRVVYLGGSVFHNGKTLFYHG